MADADAAPGVAVPPVVGDPDLSGKTAPGELHLDMGVRRQVETEPSLAQDFTAGRSLAQRGAVNADWQALIAGVPQSPSGAQPNPAAPGGQETPQPNQSPPPNEAIPLGARIAHGLWSATKDVAEGLTVEAAPQILGGALDFANNLGKFADNVQSDLAKAGVPGGAVTFTDKDGNWSPKLWSAEEWEKAKEAGEVHDFGSAIPTTGAPETVTGNIIRTGTAFALGRGSGSGALAETVGSGFAGSLARSAVSGAVGQDAAQPRLSNIINGVAPNFVTDFLRAKPDQEQGLLDNLKSGFEYAGLDALWGSAVKAVAALKAGMGGEAASSHPLLNPETAGEDTGAPTAEGSTGPQGPHARPIGPARDVYPLGDAKAPAVNVPQGPEIAAQGEAVMAPGGESATATGKSIGDYLEGMGPNPIKINLARIGAPDDIKDILAKVSTFIPKTGPVSHEETELAAAASGITPEAVLQGTQGAGGTIAQQIADARGKLLAARMVKDSSAQQFGALAAAAVDPATASPETKALALKAFMYHRAIQAEVEGAQAEAGRLLEAQKILSQSRGDFAKAFDAMLETSGVSENDMDTVLKQAADLYKNQPETLSPYMDMLHRMSGRDAIVYGFQNMLLSPKTLFRKAGTDMAMPLWNMASRYLAERFGANIPGGETAQLAYGYVASLKDGVKLAGRAIEAGRSQFIPTASTTEASDMAGMTRLYNQIPEPLSEATPTKSAAELIKYAMPTTYLGALDDAAKYVNYRAELQALAFRDAVKSGLTQGTDEFSAKMAASLQTPPSWMHEQALQSALRNTFQDPLVGVTAKLEDVVNSMNWAIPHTNFEVPVGRIVMPFFKVPVNLAAFAWRNTPLGLTYAQSQLRQALAAGGATRDIAVAKMTLGSAVSMAFMSAAYSGVMTGRGPTDPELRRAWLEGGGPGGTKAQPYSVYVGGTPYSLAPEPFAQMAGAIADTFDTMRFAKERDAEQAAFSLAFGVGNVLLDRSYMRGTAQLFDTLENPDRQAKNFTEGLLSSFLIPGTVRDVAGGFDDWYRSHYDLKDKIESDLPFVRNRNLFPQRTLWGDAVPLKDGYLPFLTGPFSLSSEFPSAAPGLQAAGKILSPVGFAPDSQAEPIDKWIWDNRKFFNPDEDDNGRLGLSRLGSHVTYSMGPGLSSSVELSPEATDRYQVLAGNELKDPRSGLGAKDTLNALIAGSYPDSMTQNQWDNATPELQARTVKKIVYDFRSAAKKQLLQEYPDIAEAVKANATQRAQQLAGVR